MGQVHFFAVRDDLIGVLAAVERRGPLTYTRTGNFDRAVFEQFGRGSDLPGLGEANADSAIACDHFLVTPAGVPLRIRPVETYAGDLRYCIDQLLNPDSIKVRAYWVGPRAYDLLRAGYRLTASVSSPREFDLASDSPGEARN